CQGGGRGRGAGAIVPRRKRPDARQGGAAESDHDHATRFESRRRRCVDAALRRYAAACAGHGRHGLRRQPPGRGAAGR
ncbi:hypothetical protein DKY64_23715, partial [Stenotrophomonas maltophilia]